LIAKRNFKQDPGFLTCPRYFHQISQPNYLRGPGVSPPDCLNYHLIARRRLTRCPSGVCARAGTNHLR